MSDLLPFSTEQQTEKHISLITNNSSYSKFNANTNITVYSEEQGKTAIDEWYKTNTIAGLDTEGNGLDPLVNDVLLLGIGNETEVFIVDTCSISNVAQYINSNILYIAHNAKYDYTMLNRSCNTRVYKWYDTMIADQKIWQGAGIDRTSNPMGFRFDLASVINRRLKQGNITLDKDVRDEFIGVAKNRYIIQYKHLEYLLEDVSYLIPLYNHQANDIRKYQLSYYIDGIAMNQIWAVGDAELAGFVMDIDAWRELIVQNKLRQFEVEILLDDEFRKIRNTKLSKAESAFIRGGKYDTPRRKVVVQQQSLFGDSPSSKEVGAANCINWGSDTQVKTIFGRLKLELPVKDNYKVAYKVPTFTVTRTKAGNKTILDQRHYKYTSGAPALESMLIDLPNNVGNDLLRLLIEHRQLSKSIETYGEAFLQKINPITGCIHTQYRTDNAKTGRWQSGGGDKNPEKINMQNVPAAKPYRVCFRGTPDELVCTADLSGAEVTIVCDKAHDEQLYEWAVINDDSHSPIAQATWRDIFWYSAGVLAGVWDSPKRFFELQHTEYAIGVITSASFNNSAIYEAWHNAHNFIINKQTNKEWRTEFKPMTFGVIYQMKDKKAGKTLNISKDEGAVGIQSIRNAIPATFAYVDSNIEKAIQQGYLVLNDRTNSRIWFPELIRCYKRGEEPSWKLIADVSGSAANAPFQGTQADMLKEAFVELSFAIRYNGWAITLPGMVHDEIVSRFNRKLNDNTLLWFSDDYKKQHHANRSIVLPADIPSANDGKLLRALDTGDAQIVNWPEFKKRTMVSASNRYLKHYKMGCDYDVLETWTK